MAEPALADNTNRQNVDCDDYSGESLARTICSPNSCENLVPFLPNHNGYLVVEPEAPPDDDDEDWRISEPINAFGKETYSDDQCSSLHSDWNASRAISERNRNLVFPESKNAPITHSKTTLSKGLLQFPSTFGKANGPAKRFVFEADSKQEPRFVSPQQAKSGSNKGSGLSNLVADMPECLATNRKIERQSQQLDDIFATLIADS